MPPDAVAPSAMRALSGGAARRLRARPRCRRARSRRAPREARREARAPACVRCRGCPPAQLVAVDRAGEPAVDGLARRTVAAMRVVGSARSHAARSTSRASIDERDERHDRRAAPASRAPSRALRPRVPSTSTASDASVPLAARLMRASRSVASPSSLNAPVSGNGVTAPSVASPVSVPTRRRRSADRSSGARSRRRRSRTRGPRSAPRPVADAPVSDADRHALDRDVDRQRETVGQRRRSPSDGLDLDRRARARQAP